MTVRIRLEAADTTELDAHETALRSVLTIPEPGSRDYPNRRRDHAAGEPGRRRYLDSAGVRVATEPAVDVETIRRQLATYRTIMSEGDVPFRQADAAAHALAAQVPALLGLADVRTSPAGAAGTVPAAAMVDDGYSPRAAAEDAKRRRDLGAEIATLRAADEDLQRQPWFPIQPGDVVLMHLPADAHSPAYGETYLAVDDDTDIAGNAMLRQVSHTHDPDIDDQADEDDGDDGPEYLLRYDTAGGRWALDTQLGEGRLKPWRHTTEHGPDELTAAQIWAHQHLGDLADPDEIGFLQWRQHADGWEPWILRPGGDQERGEDLTPFYDLWFEAGPGRLVVIRAGAVVHGRPATATPAAAAAAGKGA